MTRNAEKGAMKLNTKKGVWTAGVSMKPGSSAQFRYLVDGNDWRNDDDADAFVSNEHFSENGVLEV